MANGQILPYDRLHLSLSKRSPVFKAKVYSASMVMMGEQRHPSRFAEQVSLAGVHDKTQAKDKEGIVKPGIYTLGRTPQTAQKILATWPKDQITFDTLAAEQTLQRLGLEAISWELNAEQQALREKGELVVEPQGRLAEFQEFAARLGARSPGFAFFMEQGTGKTATALRAIDITYEDLGKPPIFRVLVVCPKSVRFNWSLEIAEWSDYRCGVMFPKAQGKALDREVELVRFWAEDYQIHFVVTTYGYLTRNALRLGKVAWDCVVLDESHKIKSAASKTAKMCLNHIRPKSAKRLLLTGTPIGNSVVDLHSQLEMLGEGYSGYTTASKFRKRYCNIQPDHEGIHRVVGDKTSDETRQLTELLTRVSFVVKKEEVLPDLPEKTFRTESVELPAELREAYNELEQEVVLKCAAVLDELPGQLQVNNILTQLLRLTQITSGYFVTHEYDENEVPISRHITRYKKSPKLERAIELVAELPGNEKAQIWSSQTEPLRWAFEEFNAKGYNPIVIRGGLTDKEVEARVQKFNTDDTCRVALGNPSAGGAGINLRGHDGKGGQDTDCTRAIYIAQNFSYLEWSQSQDRGHRRGTRKPVEIVAVLAEDTIDETVYTRLKAKQNIADNALAVQEIIKELTRYV